MSAPSSRSAVWAESGQTTAPSQGEQQSGFVTGKPPRRKMNWLLNWLDNAVQWLLGLGIPVYQAGQTYQPGARVVGADGQSYAWAHTEATTGVAPGSGGGSDHWVRWGHMPDQINAMIDTKVGTVSGALAEGTVTISSTTGPPSVSFCRALRFPGSTDKIVCCRAYIYRQQSGVRSATITLSGAAAFTNGATGAVATIESLGDNTGDPSAVLATVVNETQVLISVPDGGIVGVSPIYVEVQIRGN